VLQQVCGNMLLGLESRGRDATGYAYVSIKDGSTYVGKAPVKASDFLGFKGHLLSETCKHMPRGVILHTRFATQGKPANNQNNHPIYSKASGLCMVHNGWLLNDNELVEDYGLQTDAEVDTEVYLKLIDKFYFGEAKQSVPNAIAMATSQVQGSIACAMVQATKPRTMWLWRTYGPIELLQTDFGFVFASTTRVAMHSLFVGTRSIDVTYYKWLNLASNTLIELDESGVCSYKLTVPVLSNKYTDYLYDTWDYTTNSLKKALRRTSTTGTYNKHEGIVWLQGKRYKEETKNGVTVLTPAPWLGVTDLRGLDNVANKTDNSKQAGSEQTNLPTVVSGRTDEQGIKGRKEVAEKVSEVSQAETEVKVVEWQTPRRVVLEQKSAPEQKQSQYYAYD